MATHAANTTPSDIEAARLLLTRLGVTPEQLVGIEPAPAPTTTPTITDYLDRVEVAAPESVCHVYGSYWRRVREQWGARLLTDPTALEIRALAEQTRTHAKVRRNSRGGRSATEHMIAALRYVYRCATADGLIAETDNPAARVPKPRRLASSRRALLDHQLAEVHRAAATSGNDPDLDTLLLRLHGETACRRGGALRLRADDLDPTQCLIRLREKGENLRWQPVSPTLMAALERHHHERGTDESNGPLLRYRNGRPITYRRYDHLWSRLGGLLPWVAVQQVSTHWLRHTTLTWVERHFGYAVARAYAGHSGRSDAGTTATYVRADLYEVAQALAALSGEDHPLVDRRTRQQNGNDTRNPTRLGLTQFVAAD